MIAEEPATVAIKLVGVTKRFGRVQAVREMSLDVNHGEMLTLLGPSGCGKSTTLNMVAGFLNPDEGDILINDVNVKGRPPFQRNMGMVFQNYSLFPHMTVFENIAFGLLVRKISRSKIRQHAEHALELVRMKGLEDRYPRQLSGGQQQRVALARALIYNPNVLLLDEPLSNLDAKLRLAMREEIVDIQKKTGITALFVTHDQEEAMQISDRVVVMNNGRVEQIGTPQEVYRFPLNFFVADFLGEANFQPVTVVSRMDDQFVVQTDSGQRWKARSSSYHSPGDRVKAMVRPENLRIVHRKDDIANDEENILRGDLKKHIFQGSIHTWELEAEGNPWRVKQIGQLRGSYDTENEILLAWPSSETVLIRE